jgi:signal transduction histidine kinase/ligand-binding sensor domain-containing protein
MARASSRMNFPLHPRRICLALALAMAACAAHGLDPRVPLRQAGAQVWQTESGLPQNTVHSILQTRDGFLWAATEGGLVRFDGEQFSTYTSQKDKGLPGNLIYHLMQSRDGALWISTARGIARETNGHFHSWPTGETYATFQDRTGNLWALTASGIDRFRHGRFVTAAGATLTENSSILQSSDGTLWVSSSEGLLRAAAGSSRFVPAGADVPIQALAQGPGHTIWAGAATGVEVCDAKICHWLSVPGLPNPLFVSALQPSTASPGGMWIGTDEGLFLVSHRHARRFGAKDGLPSAQINLLFRDHEGALWIGTNRGLARFANGKIESLPNRSEVAGNIVLSAFEDREGDLWLGFESNGLGVLRSLTFTSLTVRDGLAGNYVLSVAQGPRGAMWAGTNGAGLSGDRAGRFTTLTTAQGLSSDVVMALAPGRDSTLWAGTPDGLDAIRNGHVHIYTSADGLPDDFVRSLFVDSHGTLWIGTRRGLARYANGQFATYTDLDGLGGNLIGAMLEDRRDHALWVATLGGLSRLRNGKFRNFTTADGLSSNIVTALYQDAHGTLWIATKGGGLDRYQNGRFTGISSKTSGLPESIYGILGDARGYLWLSSTHGIDRVPLAALNRFAAHQIRNLPIATFGASDGMGISECSSGGHPAAWRAANGTLWFATLKGLAIVNPAHMAMDRVPPLVALESVRVDDAPVPLAAHLRVPPGRTRVAFHYAGLSFAAPQKVRYRYQLSGFDPRWINAGNQRTAYYTNLPPGRYTFRVLASNQDGLWSQSAATITITVEPRIYQTWWFRLLLVLAVALLVYLEYRRRVRRVRSEFQAVLRERTRIAREIHDTLAQGFAAVSVQLEVVSRLLPSATEGARHALDTARALARSSLQDARTSIWDLRSQSSGQEDLATRLRNLAGHLCAPASIRTQMEVNGAYRPLAPEVETELTRIAQEAIVNAVRHSGASSITLRLSFYERQIELSVRDNGKGFADAPSAGHYGITGMRERAERIGGKLRIESRPGEGTSVLLTLPLKKKDGGEN